MFRVAKHRQPFVQLVHFADTNFRFFQFINLIVQNIETAHFIAFVRVKRAQFCVYCLQPLKRLVKS